MICKMIRVLFSSKCHSDFQFFNCIAVLSNLLWFSRKKQKKKTGPTIILTSIMSMCVTQEMLPLQLQQAHTCNKNARATKTTLILPRWPQQPQLQPTLSTSYTIVIALWLRVSNIPGTITNNNNINKGLRKHRTIVVAMALTKKSLSNWQPGKERTGNTKKS